MLATWLFRPQCAACAALSSSPLCAACSESLVPLIAQPRPTRLVDRIASAWVFGGALASAIRRLKFTGATHIARTVAPLWSPILAAALAEHADAAIVPVPLHWRRRLQRGFDQSWLLARHACAHARIARPVSLLRRVRAAPAQSTLSAVARAANLAGAFEVTRDVAGRTIILVDDVVTTGATLSAAARPLIAAGAVRVIGVTLAAAE